MVPACSRGRYDLPMDVIAARGRRRRGRHPRRRSRRTTGTPTWRRTREFATAIGDPRFDDRLGDPTPEGSAATRARYAAILDRAAGIDAGALDADGRITLAALRESAGSDIAQLDTGLLDWNLDPLEGIPANFLLIPDYQRLRLPGRRAPDARPLAGDGGLHGPASRDGAAQPRRRTRSRASRRGCGRSRILEGLLATTTADWPLLAPLEDFDDAEAGRAGRAPSATAFASELDRDRRATRSGPRSSGSTTPWSTRSCRDARSSDEPGMVPRARRRRRLPAAHPRPHVARPRRRGAPPDRPRRDRADRRRDRRARRAGRSARRASRTRWRAARRTRRCTSRTREEVFDKAAACLARAQRGDPGLVRPAARGRRARSCAWAPTRRSTRRSPTTASRRSTARGPASTSSTPRSPDDASALRGRGARLPRGRARPPPPDRDRPGAAAPAGVPPPPRADGVLRGLGPVHRAPVRRDGPLQRRTSTGSASSRSTPGARRRLVVDTGHARARLDAGAGDRRSCSTTRRSRPNNIANEVDRYIVMPGQALAYKIGQLELLRLRDEARATPRRPVRHPWLPRRRPRERRASPCRRSRGVVEAWAGSVLDPA